MSVDRIDGLTVTSTEFDITTPSLLGTEINPFGDDDSGEDDTRKLDEHVSDSRLQSSATAAYDDSLNPFAEEEEENEDGSGSQNHLARETESKNPFEVDNPADSLNPFIVDDCEAEPQTDISASNPFEVEDEEAAKTAETRKTSHKKKPAPAPPKTPSSKSNSPKSNSPKSIAPETTLSDAVTAESISSLSPSLDIANDSANPVKNNNCNMNGIADVCNPVIKQNSASLQSINEASPDVLTESQTTDDAAAGEVLRRKHRPAPPRPMPPRRRVSRVSIDFLALRQSLIHWRIGCAFRPAQTNCPRWRSSSVPLLFSRLLVNKHSRVDLSPSPSIC